MYSDTYLNVFGLSAGYPLTLESPPPYSIIMNAFRKTNVPVYNVYIDMSSVKTPKRSCKCVRWVYYTRDAHDRNPTLNIFCEYQCVCDSQRLTYFSVSSLQSFIPAESRLTPESPSLFHDRSNSLRCEGFDLRAVSRATQPSSVTPQSFNL